MNFSNIFITLWLILQNQHSTDLLLKHSGIHKLLVFIHMA